jgi:hypothetical protein
LPFHRTTTFIVCVVLLVAVIILFRIIGPRASPYTKLPHEKRPPVALAQDPDTQKTLSDALAWDFAFIPVYTAGLFLLSFIAGRFADDLNLVPFRFTKIIIAVVVAGVLFDVAENIALLRIIHGSPESLWKNVAEVGKWAKWFSPVLGNLYSLVLGIWCVVTALRR